MPLTASDIVPLAQARANLSELADEVKAGAAGRLRSLHMMVVEKGLDVAVRVGPEPLQLRDVATALLAGSFRLIGRRRRTTPSRHQGCRESPAQALSHSLPKTGSLPHCPSTGPTVIS